MVRTMSDQSESTGGLEGAVERFNRNDHELEILVQIANRAGMGLSLIVAVDGQLYSGLMIGGRQFFELAAERLTGLTTSGEGADVGEILAGRYREVAVDRYPLPTLDTDTDDSSAQPAPGYLHMKNVLVVGASLPRLPIWRIRLEDVSAWAVGEFSEAQ